MRLPRYRSLQVLAGVLGVLLGGDQRRAEHARARAVAGDPDRRVQSQPGHDVAERGVARRLEQQLAGARDAAADHDLERVERVDRVGDPDPDPLAQHAQAPQRASSPASAPATTSWPSMSPFCGAHLPRYESRYWIAA